MYGTLHSSSRFVNHSGQGSCSRCRRPARFGTGSASALVSLTGDAGTMRRLPCGYATIHATTRTIKSSQGAVV